jgi:hypothetical protein
VADSRIESFKRQVELWNADRIDEWLDQLRPDFRFTIDPSFPDAGTVEGEDMRRWFLEWAEMWDNYELELHEVYIRGEAVVGHFTWHLTGKSHVEVPLTETTLVAWFDADDRLLSAKAFFDRDAGLAAADAGPS